MPRKCRTMTLLLFIFERALRANPENAACKLRIARARFEAGEQHIQMKMLHRIDGCVATPEPSGRRQLNNSSHKKTFNKKALLGFCQEGQTEKRMMVEKQQKRPRRWAGAESSSLQSERSLVRLRPELVLTHNLGCFFFSTVKSSWLEQHVDRLDSNQALTRSAVVERCCLNSRCVFRPCLAPVACRWDVHKHRKCVHVGAIL